MSETVSIDNQSLIVGTNGFVGVNPAFVRAPIVNQQSTNYTIATADLGNTVQATANNIVLSLPNNAASGSKVLLSTLNTGTTIAAASGATIAGNSANILNLAQYAAIEVEVLSNTTGTNANWNATSLGMSSVPAASSVISLTGSPFTYTASAYGSVYVPVSVSATTIQIKRGSASAFTTGVTVGCVTVSQNDKVIFTYTASNPSATWLPV